MKILKNYKNLVALAYLLLLFITGPEDFIVVGKTRIIIYHINMFYYLILSSTFLVYSIYTNNKLLKYISFIITGIIYFVIFTIIFNIILNIKGITIGYGLYLYFLCFILFIIVIVINKEEKQIKKINEEKIIPNELTNINKELFILGKHIMGFKEIKYNSDAILVNELDNKQLNLGTIINGVKEQRKIAYMDIIDINYRFQTYVNHKELKETNNEISNLLMSAFLFSPGFSQYFGNMLLNEFTSDYEKVKIKNIFSVIIEFKSNGENKRLIIETVKNPKTFIDNIKFK